MIKKIVIIGTGLGFVLGASLVLAQLNPNTTTGTGGAQSLPGTAGSVGGVSPVQGTAANGTAAGGGTTRPKLNIACVRSAVEKRETAIQAAYDAMASAIKSALQTRKTDLLAAWTIENNDERRAALTSAWGKFRTSVRIIHSEWRRTREAAWQQFRTDRKQCGHGPTGEDPAVDASL